MLQERKMYTFLDIFEKRVRLETGLNKLQWGEQVFDTLPILQVFLLTKHVEVCNFYHRYTSTVRDGI
jgi:hypothetical protein